MQRFSFPGDYVVGGVGQGAIGNANNNCAAQLDSVASSVAAFSPTPTCGNGDVDTGEQCDLVNLNGASCESLSLGSGILQCDLLCDFDTSLCSGAVPSAPTDILIIVDSSGSYSDDLPTFQTEVPDIMSGIQAANADTRFAIVTFQDYPISPYGITGDEPYVKVIDFTSDISAVESAILALTASGGGDAPESQLTAIYEAIAGANKVSFRTAATKFIMLWTDAPFHRPELDPSYPGPTTDEVLAALDALQSRRRRLGEAHPPVNPPFPPPPTWPLLFIGISRNDDAVVLAALEQFALHTGSVAGVDDFDCDGDGVIDLEPGDAFVCPGVTGASLGTESASVFEAALEELTPVAKCKPIVTTTDHGSCLASGISINDGSVDPNDAPLILLQNPTPEPGFPVGTTAATLVVSNNLGYSAVCSTTVTVTDDEKPQLLCNIPDKIGPNDAPVYIQAEATDNCGISQLAVAPVVACFKMNKKGKRIDVPCHVETANFGALTIRNTGGVGTHIAWTIEAMDENGNSNSMECELVIANPGNGK